MAKFSRCIEGHVYDAQEHDLCPVCGAAPGDDAGLSTQDAEPTVKTPKPQSNTKGLPTRWIAVAATLLVVGTTAIYGLRLTGDSERIAKSDQSGEAGPETPDLEESTSSPESQTQAPADESPDANESADDKRAVVDEDAQNKGTADSDVADNAEEPEPAPNEERAALRARAQKHLANKDYDSAIADFTDIIRTGEGSSIDYRLRGSAYHFKKQQEAALADYNRALEFEDHDAVAHYYRAALYRDIGDIDKAIEDLTAVIEEHGSTDPNHYGERALMFVRKSFYDRAVADYDKGIELLDKDNTVDKSTKAIARYQRGWAKVQAIHKQREFCATLVGGGDCNYPQSLNDPLEDFKRAVELKPNLAAGYVEIGMILSELGNRGEALNAYTKAIKADPAYSMAYANRCLLYNLMNEKDLALADCNDAIRHDSKNALAWAYRGATYGSKRGRKNRNLAIADFRKALQVDPNNYFARESLKKLGVKP
ncbi:MAG: hypothetical protein QNJ62_10955 [Methyloceanibacter sp.]|nr:hypothetical protein [Methyloceanibacter sp.]